MPHLSIEQLFPAHVRAHMDSLAVIHGRQYRQDAAGDIGTGQWFTRELEQFMPRVLEAKLPVLNGMRLPRLKDKVDPGAETFTFTLQDSVGKAKWIGDRAQDLPKADVVLHQDTFKVKRCANYYEWTIFDLLRYQFGNRNLNPAKAYSARRGCDQTCNDAIWNGVAELGLYGVLTFPWIPRFTLAYRLDGTDAATTAQVLGAFNGWLNNTRTLTSGTEEITEVWMPIATMNYLSQTYRSDNSDITLLQALKANHPEVTSWNSAWELGSDNLFGFNANSPPDSQGWVDAGGFQQMPVEIDGLTFRVVCWQPCGGYVNEYPLGASFAEQP